MSELKESMQQAQVQQEPVADKDIDDIVTELYFRFKDWSKRGFSADDVTWCEVKADVIRLIEKHTHSQNVRRIDEQHSDIVFLIKECTCPQYNDKGMKIGSLLDGFEFARKLQDLCGVPKEGE